MFVDSLTPSGSRLIFVRVPGVARETRLPPATISHAYGVTRRLPSYGFLPLPLPFPPSPRPCPSGWAGSFCLRSGFEAP
jgi:hypothetical protein